MKAKFITFLLFSLLSSASYSSSYITEEFRDGDSNIAMLYVCSVIGHKTQKAPDAIITLAKFVEFSDIPSEKSGDFLADANTWWNEESQDYDIDGMWEGMCEQPLNNIRNLLSE